ncbi:MAG: hypothetical protein Unbinned400contig1002_28 [Prokaryotic dsDNA virus sp.]|nr:MAG: hypothetical protein Unbinned400contig1002_28 [Prokaryotic dsDNA virus sp.]|tara:strand:+ start:7878 stop:8165 length:288 start_codon:yes stop_codon:yes gene_type:complete
MGSWLANHVDVLVMGVGGAASFAALLWRGASDTQKVIGRLDMVGYRLGEVEKSVQIASDSRAKLHGRIDSVSSHLDEKLVEVRGRVVVLETKVGV